MLGAWAVRHHRAARSVHGNRRTREELPMRRGLMLRLLAIASLASLCAGYATAQPTADDPPPRRPAQRPPTPHLRVTTGVFWPAEETEGQSDGETERQREGG